MTATLQHLTLLTGHVRASPRAEVEAGTMAALRPAVAAGGGALWAGWGLTIVERSAAAAIYDLSHRGVELLRCYLAITPPDAPLWARAIGESMVGAGVAKPSELPWLADAVLAEGAAAAPSPAVWIESADAARCIAWTILETPAAAPRR